MANLIYSFLHDNPSLNYDLKIHFEFVKNVFFFCRIFKTSLKLINEAIKNIHFFAMLY